MSLLTRARIGQIEICAVTVTEPLLRHCGRQVANVGTAVLLLETPANSASVALQDGREARLAGLPGHPEPHWGRLRATSRAAALAPRGGLSPGAGPARTQ